MKNPESLLYLFFTLKVSVAPLPPQFSPFSKQRVQILRPEPGELCCCPSGEFVFPICKSKHAVSFEKRCGWYYLSPQACGNILQGNFARLELIKLLFFSLPSFPQRTEEKFYENVKLEIRRCISLIRVKRISPCDTILRVLKDESSCVPVELN